MILPTVRTDIQVRYADINAADHVSNTVYAQYLELGRVEWLTALPGGPHLSVVARLNIDFLAEIRFGDAVHLLTRCVRVGTKSLTLQQAVFAKGTHATSATTVLVAFDKAAHASVAWPAGWEASAVTEDRW